MGRIQRIQDLLNRKQVSCVELTNKYLKAIEDVNTALNAYIKITADTALKVAQKVDEKIAKGISLMPLEGVPVVLKDNIFTSGIETTCCSNMLKGYIPSYDATVWALLKEQNAILLGKANMDEFAMGCSCGTSCFGGSKNPHDTNKVPGGSSGGSAAAVSANIAAYSLGTDTGGSIRQPASFCGIVGLKPTYGAFSRYGVVAFASTLDQVGPMAATVEDVSIIYDNLAIKDPKDTTSLGMVNEKTFKNLNKDIKGIKIGLPKQYFEGLDDDVRSSINEAIKVYDSLGAEFVELDMPNIKYSLPIYYILATSEASSNLARFDGIRFGHRTKEYKDINELIAKSREEGFGEEVKRRLLLGTYMLSSGHNKGYIKEAKKIRGATLKSFDEAFKKCDVILSSTVPSTAFEHGFVPDDQMQAYMTDICTVPVNIAGLPAISVPCGKDRNEMPIGMQLIGNRFKESTILSVAHQFEKVADLGILDNLNMGVRL